jgi:hypothetical protein
VPVIRFRSVDEMGPPWRDGADPSNLRRVSEMLRLYRRQSAAQNQVRGVRRYRTIEALNEERGDPYRRGRGGLKST